MAALVITLCAILNRARGDDRWMLAWLPGRALWYVTPTIVAVALLVQPLWSAAVIGLSYLCWGVWSWSRWYDLGRLSSAHERSPDVFEATIELVSPSDHAALFLRHLMALPPLAFLGWWPAAVGVCFALAALAAYELAWRFHPRNPIWLAELGAGAAWGALIILM